MKQKANIFIKQNNQFNPLPQRQNRIKKVDITQRLKSHTNHSTNHLKKSMDIQKEKYNLNLMINSENSNNNKIIATLNTSHKDKKNNKKYDMFTKSSKSKLRKKNSNDNTIISSNNNTFNYNRNENPFRILSTENRTNKLKSLGKIIKIEIGDNITKNNLGKLSYIKNYNYLNTKPNTNIFNYNTYINSPNLYIFPEKYRKYKKPKNDYKLNKTENIRPQSYGKTQRKLVDLFSYNDKDNLFIADNK